MQVYTYSNLFYGLSSITINYTINLYGFSGQFIFFKGKKKPCKQNKTNQSLNIYVKFKGTLKISLYYI